MNMKLFFLLLLSTITILKTHVIASREIRSLQELNWDQNALDIFMGPEEDTLLFSWAKETFDDNVQSMFIKLGPRGSSSMCEKLMYTSHLPIVFKLQECVGVPYNGGYLGEYEVVIEDYNGNRMSQGIGTVNIHKDPGTKSSSVFVSLVHSETLKGLDLDTSVIVQSPEYHRCYSRKRSHYDFSRTKIQSDSDICIKSFMPVPPSHLKDLINMRFKSHMYTRHCSHAEYSKTQEMHFEPQTLGMTTQFKISFPRHMNTLRTVGESCQVFTTVYAYVDTYYDDSAVIATASPTEKKKKKPPR
jgi:hypothetical protein